MRIHPFFSILILGWSPLPGLAASEQVATQVCVYGATASGIAAAIAASRAGLQVVVIEPSRWLGGMTGGGIRAIDWGEREAIGGQAKDTFADGKSDPYYRDLFVARLAERKIPVIYEHRVAAVTRAGTTLQSLTLDYAPPDALGVPSAVAKAAAAKIVTARVFIDCSYEGDVMARAGVPYVIGRESKATYGESLAGVRPPLALYPIDPYRIPGDPASGLIPLLQDFRIGNLGDGDALTMAYCFRWKLTTKPDRLPFGEPEAYDPELYTLFRRGFAAKIAMNKGRRMRKRDEYSEESGSFFSENSSRALTAQSIAGANQAYPDGDYATRARIWKFHLEYIRGLMHFLRTDPVVPAEIRERALNTGLAPGYFPDTAGWPHQLYVREARRMRAAYILTQHDLEGTTQPTDSIGLGTYGVDDWPYATTVVDGQVALQGGEFSILRLDAPHRGIYPIPYQAIIPKAGDASNLLVPVCLSASHIAMTSTRMEPVWMIIGESAGIAATLAIKRGCAVQDVPYADLRPALLAAGQVLDRK
jgi:FAD dependent oxidoreductase